MAVLEEVRKTLVRLEERMNNLETLLPGTSGSAGNPQPQPGSPGRRGDR